MANSPSRGKDDAAKVAAARRALLEGVGREVAASFPGITRLGGQIVAALYLGDGPMTMDELAAELGRAKSNVFTNLKALEAVHIVERRREPGARHDLFALRGAYPDVIVGAYIARLREVVHDKLSLVERSLALLGDARGVEAEALRGRLGELGRKYELFGQVFDRLLPSLDGPIDVERLVRKVPPQVIATLAAVAKAAMGLGDRVRGR